MLSAELTCLGIVYLTLGMGTRCAITDLGNSAGTRNVNIVDNLSFGEYQTDLASLELSVDLGFASLTSSTAYTDRTEDNGIISTGLYESIVAGFPPAYGGYPRMTVNAPVTASDEVFTQEVRLVSQGDSKINWILGGFYKDQKRGSTFFDEMFGLNDYFIAAGLGAFTPADPFYHDHPFEFVRTVDFEDIAVFGELSYQITDAWQVTGGVRFFWQDFSQDVRIRFPYCGAYCATDGVDPLGTTEGTISESISDSIFKFNTSYDFHDDLMAYFTFSQGFRHGGANSLPTAGFFAVDPSLIPYEGDSIDNWEVGLKGNLADGTVAYTLSAFRENWDNIQLDAFLSLGIPSVVNGKGARSQGLEFEMQANLSDNMELNFAYAYTDAEIVDNDLVASGFALVPVSEGDAIPGVPKHAFSVFANYTMPLTNGSELLFHADGSYRTEFETTYNPGFVSHAILDGYEVINLVVNWKMDKYVVGLYINNLTNVEAVTAVSTQQAAADPSSSWAYVMRPRTIGISGSYRFD